MLGLLYPVLENSAWVVIPLGGSCAWVIRPREWMWCLVCYTPWQAVVIGLLYPVLECDAWVVIPPLRAVVLGLLYPVVPVLAVVPVVPQRIKTLS